MGSRPAERLVGRRAPYHHPVFVLTHHARDPLPMHGGLIDEMEISLVPLFLGQGARLFDNLGDARPELEQIRAIEAPGVAHIRYRLA